MKKWLIGILAVMCAWMPVNVAPAEALPNENFEAMVPVLDSILRCCTENDMVYDASDPDFFWSVLYYYCVNWAEEDASCEIVDGELRVPAEQMKAYAKAFFDDMEAFPSPSPDCVIRYDSDWQSYFMPLSDGSENETVLLCTYNQPNGSVSAEADLTQPDGTVIASVHAFLVPNTGNDGNQLSYSVSDAVVEMKSE